MIDKIRLNRVKYLALFEKQCIITLKTLDCGSPAIKNGSYITLSSKEILVNGVTTLLPHFVKYSCNEGYLRSPNFANSTCNGESGNFEPNIKCLISKKSHFEMQ